MIVVIDGISFPIDQRAYVFASRAGYSILASIRLSMTCCSVHFFMMSYPFRVGALGVGTVVRWKSTKRRISEKTEPNEIKSTRSYENAFRELK